MFFRTEEIYITGKEIQMGTNTAALNTGLWILDESVMKA